MRKLSDEGLQVLAPLLRGMNVSEEVSQCIREELVAKVMKCDKLIQDISPANIVVSNQIFNYYQQQITIFPSKNKF